MVKNVSDELRLKRFVSPEVRLKKLADGLEFMPKGSFGRGLVLGEIIGILDTLVWFKHKGESKVV